MQLMGSVFFFIAHYNINNILYSMHVKRGVPKEENIVCTCKCLLQASTEIEAMVPGENRNQLQTFLIFYMLKCWYPFSLIAMRVLVFVIYG